MSDFSTQEILRAHFRLRDDLVIAPRGGTRNVVQIQSGERFFRVGIAEYTFISLLDGKTSVAEALSLTASQLGADGFTQTEAVTICRWLIDSGLATNANQPQAPRGKATAKWHQRWNPFWIKLPLMNPDRLLTRLQPVSGWIHHPITLILAAVMFVVALATVGTNFSKLSNSSFEVLSVSNWLWLSGLWLVLKIVHEISHGLACKRYGGKVPELGLVFILFAPLAYVDLTASWKLPSKWHRIHTALAGIYAELLLASVAVFVWANTSSPELASRCLTIMWLACITTVVFNANVLMRFDGYYALSDLLEIPNLYQDAKSAFNSVLRAIFFGDRIARNTSTARHVFLITYATAALVWKIVVCTGLAITAATLFHGGGILLAAVAVGMWIGLPLWKSLGSFTSGVRYQPARTWRCVVIATVCLITTAGLLFFAPWPGGRTAPATVEYSPPTHVRARISGRVETIHVANGQPVHAGDLLLELSNPELKSECEQLELSIEQSIAQRRLWIQKKEYGQATTEFSNLLSLQNQLAEKRAQLAHLQIRATADGTVRSRYLADFLHTHIKAGTELLVLGNEASKELRLSISDDDIDIFRANLAQPVNIHLPNSQRLPGILNRLNPRGTVTPSSPVLCATNGGWIPVKEAADTDSETKAEFLQPRFDGRIVLDAAASKKLNTGQTALVTIGRQETRLIAGLYHAGSKWVTTTAVQIGLR